MDEELTDDQKQEILEYLVKGQKIEAIKVYREATGAGLKEAKDVIDAWDRKLRAEHPDQMPAAKSGCGAVVLGAILILAAAASLA